MEGVRSLCGQADVIALQETWLLPHDLSMLTTIADEFGGTGTSAVDTSAGLLRGRPYGGVALLWRKSVFQSTKAGPIEILTSDFWTNAGPIEILSSDFYAWTPNSL
ncbi:reverse transcriptase, partial [Operophtera brumata]